MKNLVFFTSSYPYQKGEQFIETEIKYLSKYFEKIIIVPAKFDKIVRDIPENVYVDNFVALSDKSYLNRIKSLFNKNFFYNLILDINTCKYMAIGMLYVEKYQRWIDSFLKETSVYDCLFYSYWFSHSTAALYFAKKKFPDLVYVTRVHRGDLYEDIHNIKAFPFRKKIVGDINMIFAISNSGKNHILKKYPEAREKIIVSKLGVNGENKLSKPSSDNVLRMVSCSSLISEKRVHLIISALSCLKNQNIKVKWLHIGDGYLRKSLEKQAKKLLADNIQYDFSGFRENKEIYSYYQNNNVDLFINVSSNEGIPVSIMEAQSFGIPCIATNVGGNSEIVNNKNGYLLGSNPLPEEIARLITDCYKNKNAWNLKRKESYNNWKTHYDADTNYKNFCENLIKIGSGKQ